MLRKNFLLIAFVIINSLYIVFPNNTYPAVTTVNSATLTEFTITVTKIEISYDGGSTYQDYYSGATQVNIASVSAGSKVNSFSAVNLPAGTINKVRITIEHSATDSISFRGYCYSSGIGKYCYHNSAYIAEYAEIYYQAGTKKGTKSGSVPSPERTQVYALPEGVYLAALDANISVHGDTTIKLNFALANSITAAYNNGSTWIYPSNLSAYCSVSE